MISTGPGIIVVIRCNFIFGVLHSKYLWFCRVGDFSLLLFLRKLIDSKLINSPSFILIPNTPASIAFSNWWWFNDRKAIYKVEIKFMHLLFIDSAHWLHTPSFLWRSLCQRRFSLLLNLCVCVRACVCVCEHDNSNF